MNRTEYRVFPVNQHGIWSSHLQFQDIKQELTWTSWFGGKATRIERVWRYIPYDCWQGIYTRDECPIEFHWWFQNIQASPEGLSTLVEFAKKWPVIDDYLEHLRQEYARMTSPMIVEV